MSVFTVHNAAGELVFETDSRQALVHYLNMPAKSLQVSLSSGKGICTRGRGDAKLTIRQHEAIQPGPKAKDWLYLLSYQEWTPEYVYEVPEYMEHEISLDEIYMINKLRRAPETVSTVDAKIQTSAGLRFRVLSDPRQFNYTQPRTIVRTDAVVYRQRFEELATPHQRAWYNTSRQAFEAWLQAFRAHPRYAKLFDKK